MAVLQAQADNSNGFDIEALAPEGDYVATCLDIQDEFGVIRRKYQSEETEEQDVTRMLFGFKGKDNQLHKIQTWEMKISGSPKSKLFNFLSDWIGQAPQMGWDYCSMKGQGAVIRVEHKTSQLGKVYAVISTISPVKTSLADYTSRVIPAEQFNHNAPQNNPQVPNAPSPSTSYAEDENIPF